MLAGRSYEGERRGNTLRDCESRAPLVPQNVQTNATVGVDVGVVYASGEVDLGGLEGIICREMDR